ncbi:DUF2062 domain-containing protein [Terriglobus sp. ADX1]|uniref:DUF2062 domain-containing protein n=1 Tax=Terriglobus sp. ADX1 TaxID=2794063 RepID=UPI002FE50269
MITVAQDVRHSWLRRTIVSPVVRLLRRGASPKRLAWSLTIGFIIGINPVIGSTTVLTIAVSHLFRLNHPASQLGTHSAYPFQILLLLPFLQAGSLVFGMGPLPLQPSEILQMVKTHPLDLLRTLWTWEWHALVLWAVMAAVLTPTLAMLLTRILERATRKPRTAV